MKKRERWPHLPYRLWNVWHYMKAPLFHNQSVTYLQPCVPLLDPSLHLNIDNTPKMYIGEIQKHPDALYVRLGGDTPTLPWARCLMKTGQASGGSGGCTQGCTKVSYWLVMEWLGGASQLCSCIVRYFVVSKGGGEVTFLLFRILLFYISPSLHLSIDCALKIMTQLSITFYSHSRHYTNCQEGNKNEDQEQTHNYTLY